MSSFCNVTFGEFRNRSRDLLVFSDAASVAAEKGTGDFFYSIPKTPRKQRRNPSKSFPPPSFLFSPLGFVLWHSSVQESRETEEEEECLLIQDREREDGGKGGIVLLSTSLLSEGDTFIKPA